MSFYQILQMDPGTIKKLIKLNDNQQEKNRLRWGMAVRSILIVAFAIFFITVLTFFFGSENSSMAVVLYCMLLAVRFVDFGYCARESLIALAVILLLLLVSPVLAVSSSPILALIIHFSSFFTILLLSADKPEMGNGSLFSFSYIFLSGNPVYGSSLYQRFLMTIVGFVICGAVFYKKHAHKHQDVHFISHLQKMDLSVHKYQWMIRFTLGISLLLTIGSYFQIRRFMWAGFACASLLSDHSEEPLLHERFWQRLLGVLEGSLIFFIIYTLMPLEYHFLIGPLGGVCLGFCSEYKYKTLLNSLGALLVASSIYGLHQAIFLRISDTLFGILFALIFYWLFDYFSKLTINRIQG